MNLNINNEYRNTGKIQNTGSHDSGQFTVVINEVRYYIYLLDVNLKKSSFFPSELLGLFMARRGDWK